MIIKKLNQKALDAWVTSLIAQQTVYGVQAKGKKYVFDNLERAEDLRLDYDVTILPPKKYFMPPKSSLSEFKEGVFASTIDNSPFILLGVHPYDVAALKQMDTIFSSDNFDSHYMSRRENAVIIATDVQNCSENNFSGCMNTAVMEDGYDILISKINSDYIVEAKTPKGEKLSALIKEGEAVSDSDKTARSKMQAANKENLKKHSLKPALDQIGAILDKTYNHPVWQEKAESCFSCGSCVLVCPTCYCFDVKDEVEWDLASGKRVRMWDGCMLEKFAEVAGDHNFREKKQARYRHRYLRKGSYVAKKVGEIACVGCGRCISSCVSKIANPVEIFNTLMEA